MSNPYFGGTSPQMRRTSSRSGGDLVESTKKIRTYSPPRRESIEDHLEALRRRAPWLRDWLHIEWTPKLASAAWIRSLAVKKKGIIHGPVHEGGKSEGPGVRSRFSPRAYRELIEVIRLKSLGVKSRNSWLLHLWLRGHEYPMRRVRTALIAEARKRVSTVVKEVAPTGRFRYNINRRLKRISAKSGKRDYGEFLNFLYAMMARPSEMRNVDIDAQHFAMLLCEGTRTSVNEALPLAERLLASVKAGEPPDTEVELGITSILQQSSLGRHALETLRSHPHAEQIVHRIHGLFADDRGRSRLLDAIQGATDEQLVNARQWRSFWRRVNMVELKESMRNVAPELRAARDVMWDMIAMLRRAMFSHPEMDAYVFMLIVDDEMPAQAPDLKRGPVDGTAILRALANVGQRTNRKDEGSGLRREKDN